MIKKNEHRGTNIIVDDEGRTYHVGVKSGEVAHRILLVGEASRAQMYAGFLEGVKPVGSIHRGFHAYTGTYHDVPITVLSVGMGLAMMDFAVRELAQVTSGPLWMIRIGTAGSIHTKVGNGTIALAASSGAVQTDYSQYEDQDSSSPFRISSRRLKADPVLISRLEQALLERGLKTAVGTDITADGFYASQGRQDKQFADHNEHLIEQLQKTFPDACSLQMETYHLYHLANIVRDRKIFAAALTIILAQRSGTEFLDTERKNFLEKETGLATLGVLALLK